VRRSRYSPMSVISRYLVREFVGMLLPIVMAFVILYLVVDVFDRLSFLLKNHATVGAAVRYFLFKIPLILTQIMPPAVLAALLLSLGMLSRQNEIVALRASGISLVETAVPLLVLGTLMSLATLVWDETVVPYCTRQSQYVNNNEIRKRVQRAILSDREIWYHGADGFYNIDHIDPQRRTLFGLTIYQTDANFDLRSIIQVPAAEWTDAGWRATGGAVERTVASNGDVATKPVPDSQLLRHETLNDFLELRPQAEELSYLELQQRIADLARKGIDASNYFVDLQLKLAVPFTSLVFACLAIPLAGRVQRHPSLAQIVLTGLATGFGYWVTLALTNALGTSGVLPPVVSAWAANVIFLFVGMAIFLTSE
jgi:lipopolysaccharide export system permease protein